MTNAEIIQHIRGELSTYGDHANEHPDRTPDLVRCADCKHRSRGTVFYCACGYYVRKGQPLSISVGPDHFCGYGEAKDD